MQLIKYARSDVVVACCCDSLQDWQEAVLKYIYDPAKDNSTLQLFVQAKQVSQKLNTVGV